MFDSLVAAAHRAGCGVAVGAWARVENAAAARRLSAMADVLEEQFAEDGSADREQWCLDNWKAVSAEVAAHHGVSLGVASHQLALAMALREELPRVAEVFEAGHISLRLVNTIVYRTALIDDPEARAKVDVELAAAAADWGTLSDTKVEANIDFWVDRYDSFALRRTEYHARGRHVSRSFDGRGTSTIEAVLFDHDGAALDARLDAMAGAVCENDPRTIEQRRADALGVLGHGGDRLPCLCDTEGCEAAGVAPSAVVIYAIADERSLTDDTPAELDGKSPDEPISLKVGAVAGVPLTGPPRTPPAVLLGGGELPAPLLAAKVAAGATIRYLVHPCDAAPEPRYRPSAKLARFVRSRDMTCRFPGCKKSAVVCDVDHTIAYPVGPTCASNLKCLCREHHLLKTFWAGARGWRDEQLPDGTVVWTDPHGEKHITKPGSYGIFPKLCEPTAPVVLSDEQRAALAAAEPASGLTMPRRRRTRAQGRADRIAAERRLNERSPQRISDRHRSALGVRPWEDYLTSWRAGQPPDDDDDPPPF